MENIKNEFYLSLSDDDKEKYKVLFNENNNTNNNTLIEEFIAEQNTNDKIDLSFIYFHNDIQFINKIYKNKIYFNDSHFMQNVSFEGSTFKKITNFNRVVFNKECSFENVNFKKEIEFRKVHFKDNAKFSTSRFEKFASFEEATFHKEVDFENAIAKDLFYFHNVSLGKLNLIGSHFDKANFLRLHNNDESNKVVTKDNFNNKDSVRILKSHFEMENNITDANMYFVIEQEFYLELLRKKNAKYPNKNINKTSLLFSKYVSDYGTDWVRVLIIMFGFGFFASLIYSFFDTKDYSIIFTLHEQCILFIEMYYSLILYCLYIENINSKNWFWFFIFLGVYIVVYIYSDTLPSLNNKVATLLNPFNIFKPHKEYFKDIVLYGLFIKVSISGLFYQFIISFRNSSRRK